MYLCEYFNFSKTRRDNPGLTMSHLPIRNENSFENAINNCSKYIYSV